MRSILILFIFAFPVLVWSQDSPTGEIEDAQIIIEKDKPLTLPKASRLYLRTEILPVKQDTFDVTYQISQPGFQFDPYSFFLKQRAYQGVSMSSALPNYVRAGFGNYISPLFEGFVSKKDKGQEGSVWIFHESFGKGPIRDDQSGYAFSEALISGGLTFGDWVFKPSLNYERQAYFFYGYNQEAYLVSSAILPYITDKISSQYVSISPELEYSQSEDLSVLIKPMMDFTGMGVAGGESFNSDAHYGIQLGGSKVINPDISADLNVEYHFLSYKSDIEQNRTLFSIDPSVTKRADKFIAKAGLGFAVLKDSATAKSQIAVYPDVAFDYFISDKLGVYSKIGGGVKATDLYQMQVQNPYLQDSLVLNNEKEQVNFEAGLKVGLVEGFLLKPFFGYSSTQNKAIFNMSNSDTSRFEILYAERFQKVDVGVQVEFQTSNSAVSGKLTYSSLKTDSLAYAWNIPTTRLDINFRQKVGKSLVLKANLYVLDGMKIQRFDNAEEQVLPTISDLGISADYAINEKMAVFLKSDNLFNQKYQRYLNYPTRGISLKLGFIYRF